MKNRRFVFVKECNGIPKGSQLDLVEGRIYLQTGVNGGQVPPTMYNGLMELIKIEDNKHMYLREVPIPYNKA